MQSKTTVLTIAGSDSGGGAGIQSDLKTFQNYGVYGVTVITAITSQNTKGVQNSFEVPAKHIKSQLNSVFSDFRIKAVKTGMLSSSKVIDAMYYIIKDKRNLKLVIDPVIYSKNGFTMLDNNGIKTLIKKLLPLSYIITPNLAEAEILSGIKIKTVEDVEVACEIINDYGAKNVLIKGGHFSSSLGLPEGSDVLYSGRKFYIFPGKFVDTKHTHGIGCTLSAAITANLALGKSLETSILESKIYIQNKLKKLLKIGKGINPVEQ